MREPPSLPDLLRNLLLLVVPSLVASLLLFELCFRFVIPAAEVPRRHFDAEQRVMRFDTEGPRDGVFTRGRLAEVRGRWHINDEGWNSDVEYLPAGSRAPGRPLIAIIGDSYVNGFQVDLEQNLASVLRELVGPDLDVYGFGMPGAPLSQYLQMSRYVARRFDPAVMAFVVVHNDFLESLWDVRANPSFLQLRSTEDGWVEVPPTGPPETGQPAWMKSALMRYLRITLQSRLLVQQDAGGRTTFVANVPVDELGEHRRAVRQAVAWTVERIHRENPSREIVFLMDAPRADLYAGRLAASPVAWLTEALADACRDRDLAFIDLAVPFGRLHERDGSRFESAVDAHWNAEGHRQAALALGRALAESGTLPVRAARAVEAAASLGTRP